MERETFKHFLERIFLVRVTIPEMEPYLPAKRVAEPTGRFWLTLAAVGCIAFALVWSVL